MPADRRPLSSPSPAGDVRTAAIRDYLVAVYPAASDRLHRLKRPRLVRLYETLDYYYAASPAAVRTLQPRILIGGGGSSPTASAAVPMPYIPNGAFYHALGAPPLDHGRLNAVLWGNYDRHDHPVEVLQHGLLGAATERFHSSFGARMGPQPSWTSPLAIVRYVHHPNGLEWTPQPSPRHSPRKARVDSRLAYFDLGNTSRAHPLARLRDGDAIEVEQWGGLLGADECPPICGLWANVWRGTGVMLRVRRPFASLNKATAIIEMIEQLGARNASALEALTAELGASRSVRRLRERHPAASLAARLCAHMLAVVPCASGHRGPQFAALAKQWEEFARSAAPDAVVSEALELSRGARATSMTSAHRFAMHWTLGICGKGRGTPFWRASPVGPDGLLTALACMLGHKTVVLAASANDNGLLHQELVDYELPEPLGWRAVAGRETNDAAWCLAEPFRFVQDDARRGARAQEERRRQMHEFWRATGKFALPTDPTDESSRSMRACGLGFGSGGPGELAACRGPKVRVPRPTSSKACWAWCNGTLSQELASVSLGHVRLAAESDAG